MFYTKKNSISKLVLKNYEFESVRILVKLCHIKKDVKDYFKSRKNALSLKQAGMITLQI